MFNQKVLNGKRLLTPKEAYHLLTMRKVWTIFEAAGDFAYQSNMKEYLGLVLQSLDPMPEAEVLRIRFLSRRQRKPYLVFVSSKVLSSALKAAQMRDPITEVKELLNAGRTVPWKGLAMSYRFLYRSDELWQVLTRWLQLGEVESGFVLFPPETPLTEGHFCYQRIRSVARPFDPASGLPLDRESSEAAFILLDE